MMGPWKAWYNVALVISFLLSLSVVYFIGKSDGRKDEKLAANHGQIVSSDSVTKSATSRTDSARKRSDLLTDNRATLRAHVKIVHDTIYTEPDTTGDGQAEQDSTQGATIVNAEIYRLIQADDSVIAAQKHSLALQDTLIASLRVGITRRDTRIKILESEVTPGKFKRILTATKWIAIGAVIGAAYQHR